MKARIIVVLLCSALSILGYALLARPVADIEVVEEGEKGE